MSCRRIRRNAQLCTIHKPTYAKCRYNNILKVVSAFSSCVCRDVEAYYTSRVCIVQYLVYYAHCAYISDFPHTWNDMHNIRNIYIIIRRIILLEYVVYEQLLLDVQSFPVSPSSIRHVHKGYPCLYPVRFKLLIFLLGCSRTRVCILHMHPTNVHTS